ncbi:DUF885 domain-containing protein [Pinibacter soli]|uniref:DUF885 domain-containing protein n=1 Tax=Pinibacter soli TaxID=3044211 RepID=A0ABT6RDJ9_9BACT|nr:DUF885 domain-containing protein [Pinibacter soli]MDI3320658.1 DUF885 domain-containing protein [Pinibacter soli]
MSLTPWKITRSKLIVLFIAALPNVKLVAQSTGKNESLHLLFDEYHEEGLKLNPLSATMEGDDRFNDLLPNDGAASFIKASHAFYTKYQNSLKTYNYQKLNAQDKLSYDILMDVIERRLGSEKFHPEYMPVNQMDCLPLLIGQLGSGSSFQPFKTLKDYNDWLKRIAAFSHWTDTAIANMRKGIKAGYVLPKALVVKMIPQMTSLAEMDSSKSIFYGPVRNFPTDFSKADKARLTAAYFTSINQQLIPCFKKLADFLSNDYLPQARTSSGINALPHGDEMYRFAIYYNTTTHKTADEIYQTGLNEVARITAEMVKIKDAIGFKGSLNDLFQFMKTNKQFMPFKTKEEVLNANRAVLSKIDEHLNNMFGVKPRTPFEIREVEAYRAAAAPPQYAAGSPDATRPGIYYVPIVDPTKINTTAFALEATFLHEAIPGHHFQISLQQENNDVPKFRRFLENGAFVEGWGLYAESLGDQLGCYTDPYQKLGALGNEIHRAIRLVVDAGIHTGKMTREDAIRYMMDHESLSETRVIAEIERYMADPGQAVSYKTGELKIKELRDKYQRQLGTKFSLKSFHDAILNGGPMPLDVFERYMDDWAKTL